jgi:hypothetical protein
MGSSCHFFRRASYTMTDIATLPAERRRNLHFEWVWPMLVRPRRALGEIAGQTRSAWITPLLILTALALISVLIAGPLRREAVASTPPEIPPNFQYMTPEEQAQFMSAQQTSSGPMFTYGFPAISSVLGVWVGWLILGGLLHLVLTLLGSRSSSVTAMNVVAWASLPLGARSVVQSVAMLAGHSLISKSGLSGFGPVGGNFALYLGFILALIDLYLIWQIALLIIGVRQMSGIKPGKVVFAILFSLAILLVLQALPSYIGAKLSSLSIARPFFF